jgi:hypothetical protein
MASIEELSLSDHEDAPQLVASDADLEKVIVRPPLCLLFVVALRSALDAAPKLQLLS